MCQNSSPSHFALGAESVPSGLTFGPGAAPHAWSSTQDDRATGDVQDRDGRRAQCRGGDNLIRPT